MIEVQSPVDASTGHRALVLLHAFPLSSAMWRGLLPLLRTKLPDLRLFVQEFPGFGTAPRQAGWRMRSFAAELSRELKLANLESVVLAGISMGGYGAFAVYRDYPELVQGLILSNTKAAADSAVSKIEREVFALDVEKRGSVAAVERMLPKFITPSIVADRPELPRLLETMILEADPAAIADALRSMAERPDSTELLPTIKIPTLVVTGEHDPFGTPGDARAMASQLQRGSCSVIPAAGHLTPIDDPEAWCSAVSHFIQSI